MNRLRYALGAVAVAILAGFAPCAEGGADWVIRPLVGDVSGMITSADMMVGPSGDVVAGYSLFTVPSVGGPVTLARLDGRLFDYSTFSKSATTPSFAMDGFGSIYYAANNPQRGANYFGYDLGGFAGISDAEITLAPSSITRSFLALDRGGVPAVVGVKSGDTAVTSFSVFDVRTGTWQNSEISIGGNIIGNNACFDASNTPVLASITSSGSTSLSLSRPGLFGWQSTVIASDLSGAKVGMAPYASGGVALVYGKIGGGVVLVTAEDSGAVIKMTLPLPAGLKNLGLHCLAIDSAGNPAIVYGDPTTHSLYYATRTSPETWSAELLPVSADWGSLAFDAAGNPYILAVRNSTGSHRIQMLSPVLPALARGDFSGDDAVDAADIDLLLRHFGTDFFYDLTGDGKADRADVNELLENILYTGYGDADLDGFTDFADFQRLLDNWQKIGGWADADFTGEGTVDFSDFQVLLDYWNPTGWSAPAVVPEPASATLLAVGAVAVLRRTRRRG